MSPFCPSASIRKLFAVLVALAVFIAPALTRAGEVYAAAPDHHMQMMEAGHCHSSPDDHDQSTGDHDKSIAKSCCVAMCMALAVTPSTPADSTALRVTITALPPRGLHLGYLGEIATPPPRLA